VRGENVGERSGRLGSGEGRPRFPPLIAGLRKSWGAKINHMRRIPLSDAFPRLRALHWVIASLNSSSMCPIVRTYALPPSLPPGGCWTYVGARASGHCPMSTLSTASQRVPPARGGVLELRQGRWGASPGRRNFTKRTSPLFRLPGNSANSWRFSFLTPAAPGGGLSVDRCFGLGVALASLRPHK
jgi:hypothetical protein